MQLKLFNFEIGVLITVVMISHNCFAECKLNIGNIARQIGLAPDLIASSNLEVSDCSNLSIKDNHIEFILNKSNPKVNNGIRSELAIGYPYNEGDIVQYKWSMLLPSKAPPEGRIGQWWTVAQWHDQPDPFLGETWNTFKSQSPPIAIYVEKRGDDIGIGLAKAKGVKVSWEKVPLDEWLDVEVIIKWSTANDGNVDFIVSSLGKPSIRQSFRGSNMNNRYHHYFKVGQYRHPDYDIKAELLIKNIEFNKLDQPK